MPVHNHEAAGTIVVELIGELCHEVAQHVIADGERAGKAEKVVGVPEGNGRGDEDGRTRLVRVLFDKVEQKVGGQGVRAERIVATVLLRAADGHHDKVVALVEVPLDSRPRRKLNAHDIPPETGGKPPFASAADYSSVGMTGV